MSLKNIYLVQAGEKFSAKNKTAYLPYAAGTIAAQAWSNEIVKNAFKLDRIIFLREPIEQILNSVQDPFLVGFSCYLWNSEYNKAVAKAIKAVFQKCIVVFGGHNVPSDTSLLEECDYIDILVHKEGEEVFEKILCCLANNMNLSEVQNISYRGDDHTLVQTARTAITGCDYPSPYTGGFFDSIIRDNPDVSFSGILETNRGCPNNCAFCDWGPRKEKVRLFPLERIKSDIEWLSEHRIEYVWEVDANFGQFERDSLITDWLIAAKKRNGYPNRIYMNYAKYNNHHVFELARRFSEVDLSKSTTISLQTLSDEVLNNIGRKNMTLKHFSELITLYMKAEIPTYSELILGLPGETYESFTTGMGKLLESGQHSGIEVYDCNILINSTLADKDYIREYGIKAVHVPFFTQHSEVTADDTVEYADIVISTKSLSSENWVKCKLFANAVQSLHCLGLLRNFAIYLHNENQLAYEEFYIKLIEWYFDHPLTIGYEVFNNILIILQKMTAGINIQYYYNRDFGNVRWFLDEGAFLCFISDIDRFYTETSEYLRRFNIEEALFEQLLNYQKNIICVPNNKSNEISLSYDFYHYFSHISDNEYKPLEKIRNIVKLSSGDSFSNHIDYAREVLWYGRRLVKTICTSNPNYVSVDFF